MFIYLSVIYLHNNGKNWLKFFNKKNYMPSLIWHTKDLQVVVLILMLILLDCLLNKIFLYFYANLTQKIWGTYKFTL